jgi:hypothetical protein
MSLVTVYDVPPVLVCAHEGEGYVNYTQIDAALTQAVE